MGPLGDASVLAHLPVVAGIGAVVLGGIIGVLKGYRWLLAEIKTVITAAIEHHTEVERTWQHEIERRLTVIESKVDRIIEGSGQ